MRELAMLKAAESLAFLLVPPGNRLERSASESTIDGGFVSDGRTKVPRTLRSSTTTEEME